MYAGFWFGGPKYFAGGFFWLACSKKLSNISLKKCQDQYFFGGAPQAAPLRTPLQSHQYHEMSSFQNSTFESLFKSIPFSLIFCWSTFPIRICVVHPWLTKVGRCVFPPLFSLDARAVGKGKVNYQVGKEMRGPTHIFLFGLEKRAKLTTRTI